MPPKKDAKKGAKSAGAPKEVDAASYVRNVCCYFLLIGLSRAYVSLAFFCFLLMISFFKSGNGAADGCFGWRSDNRQIEWRDCECRGHISRVECGR